MCRGMCMCLYFYGVCGKGVAISCVTFFSFSFFFLFGTSITWIFLVYLFKLVSNLTE